MTEQIIKCKFCDWTCKKGWKNKKGEYKSGYYQLKEHVFVYHQKEFQTIQDRMGEEDEL